MQTENYVPNAEYRMRPVAHIRSVYPEKFGIPRQSGLVDSIATITLEKEFASPEIVRGLEQFSHLWLLWIFSEHAEEPWHATVRPPRLGGNERFGVFATRSPFRPNPIGLSCVELLSVDTEAEGGPVLHVKGADLMDGTPILDIKPYIPYADARPEATEGFTSRNDDYRLTVDADETLLALLPEELRPVLLETLAQDPRPQYHDDPERVYGMALAGYNITFRVADNVLRLLGIEK